MTDGVLGRLVGWGAQRAEAGRLPDAITRFGIRRMLAERLKEQRRHGPAARRAFREQTLAGPIALVPEKANEQHYELPPDFFGLVLGPRLKYSCAYFDSASTSLAEAEESMLALTCRRAQIADGQRILDLGCGWGSLSLWIAEHYPNARVLGVSNSKDQREFILGECARRNLDNVEIVTADMNRFAPDGHFDRVVSVEMFEHMRNWELLLGRVRSWLAPSGKLFVHVFCHREHAYPYEDRGDGDWMARHFFSGGLMPSEDWIASFDRDLAVEASWRVGGRHYQRTSEAWLEQLDEARDRVMPVLRQGYGDEAERWFHRWRLFFLGCAELFGHHGGREWFVAHYRLAAREDVVR